ncbi:GyrI-like domain-containing protein [Brassicibacter mesophilus]|uniref:GyrI-like domain-containing protein n=1 Tax=Brassicibacter mesophilus TaxID=745119 RepID=UPI003D1AAA40
MVADPVVTLPPMMVILSQVYGDEEHAPYEAWRNILNWSKNNVSITESKYYVFNNYNIRRKNIRRYYIAMVSCMVKPNELETGLSLQILEGGKYICARCNFTTLPNTWEKLINYININNMKVNPKLKWREEWHIKDNKLKSNSNPEITIYCPIK